MTRGHIICGLDIGSSAIKALVAQKNGENWEILHYAQVPSFGLRRGAVVNVEETSKNIQILMSNIERDCNIKIHSVFVNMGGSHLYVTPSDGIVSVSRADQRVSEEDKERVLQAARAINIPPNEDILEVFPKEFIIDDQKGIKKPVGLTGKRLEVKVFLLCYFQSYFTYLTDSVLNANLQINDIVPSPLAAAQAVLTPQQKELGVALIDIGADTTSIVVFEEGELIHLAVLPLGSANITKDIAIGFRTNISVAEDIKKQYGTCIISADLEKGKKSAGGQRKKIEIFEGSSEVSFTEKDLSAIIIPRVSEILDLMQKELKKIGRQELLPAGVVLTGGGAKLPGIKDLAKEHLRLPCEIGLLRGLSGVDQDPSLATVTGLVLGAVAIDDSRKSGMMGLAGNLKKIASKFKKIFKIFIP